MHIIGKVLGAAALACSLVAAPSASQAQQFGGMGHGMHHGSNWSSGHHGGGGNWGRGNHGGNWGGGGHHGGGNWGGGGGSHFYGGNSFSFSFSVAPRHRNSWAAHVRRCERAYRTYDWHTDTYIGKGGRERRCRL